MLCALTEAKNPNLWKEMMKKKWTLLKKPKAEISLNVGSLETSFQINETEMHYHQAALWLNQKLSAEPTRLLKATGQCQWERRTNWAFRGASARWA